MDAAGHGLRAPDHLGAATLASAARLRYDLLWLRQPPGANSSRKNDMPILVRRLALKNYKSIATAIVDFGGLTVLVGPNGVGKSNFIDALRFVADSLNGTLDLAMRQRGGIGEVRRHSGGHPNHFAISLRLHLEDQCEASYAFRVGARPNGGFVVQQEQAVVSRSALGQAHFNVENGQLVAHSNELSTAPRAAEDRLYLTSVSGIPEFRPLFDALTRMAFYNINPAEIRETPSHDQGEVLARDGWNLAAVIKRLEDEKSPSLERIQEYLRQIVPDVERVEHQAFGPRETLVFRQRVQKQEHPWRFYAASMSDGTLRSLGVLTSLFQFTGSPEGSAPLIAIEEPESTVHPGAAATLMDALVEATGHEQVVMTTHSPDLLEHESLRDSNMFAVNKRGGETIIAPVDQAALTVIKEGLYTPGELLRVGQLQPDHRQIIKTVTQRDLFEAVD